MSLWNQAALQMGTGAAWQEEQALNHARLLNIRRMPYHGRLPRDAFDRILHLLA
jgi:hypothetical protein